nr:beta-1,4-galactosyltransferase 6 [Pogona vitticeps]
MPLFKKALRLSNRSIFVFVFVFSFSSSCLYFIYVAPGIANTYLFMVQARGIMLKENVKTIGHMIRLYTNKNSTLNGTDYSEGNNTRDSFAQTVMYLPENFSYSPCQPCPEKLPHMRGFIDANMSEISLEEIQQMFSKDLDIEPGGHWKPKDCKPRWKVAILIPFRNRHEHLPIFFRHLIPVLQKQRLEFAFYVVEQVSLPYNEFFGGVSGLTVEQFKKINGFPNAFWGWGGEDDDLWNRVHYVGYNVTRPEGELGKYKSIPHHHRGEVQFLGRYKLLRYSRERQYIDGLNNLLYTPTILVSKLYTNITVNLIPELAPVQDY